MRNIPQPPTVVETGTLMQKPIPPRLVEPYLTGRRAVIAGFVYRAADTSFTTPSDFYVALDLGYVRNWSLAMDVRILARTPWAILRGKGAY